MIWKDSLSSLGWHAWIPKLSEAYLGWNPDTGSYVSQVTVLNSLEELGCSGSAGSGYDSWWWYDAFGNNVFYTRTDGEGREEYPDDWLYVY